MEPVISIVLTSCNSEDTISDVLDALVSQDMPLNMVELIIIDDGSRDQTVGIIKEFLEEYGQRFNSVQLIIHEKNSGVSKSRNDGIKAAKGDYILILDDDILLGKTTLRRLFEYLRCSPPRIAAVLPIIQNYMETNLQRWGRLIQEGRITCATSISGCVLIKRKTVEEIGLYDETIGIPFTMGEEIEYGARVRSRGYKIHRLGFEKVFHINISQNICRQSVVSEMSRGEKALSMLNRLFDNVKSIYNPRYRYAYKKYVGRLPFLEKAKWYSYSFIATLTFLVMVMGIVYIIGSSILSPYTPWNLYLLQTLGTGLIVAYIIHYIVVLKEYWNSKVPYISVVFSLFVLLWRVVRSLMLLMPKSGLK